MWAVGDDWEGYFSVNGKTANERQGKGVEIASPLGGGLLPDLTGKLLVEVIRDG